MDPHAREYAAVATAMASVYGTQVNHIEAGRKPRRQDAYRARQAAAVLPYLRALERAWSESGNDAEPAVYRSIERALAVVRPSYEAITPWTPAELRDISRVIGDLERWIEGAEVSAATRLAVRTAKDRARDFI